MSSFSNTENEDLSERVWLIVAGRGSNVAAEENDLEFEVTEWKRVIWKKYKGQKIVFMHDTLR